MLHILYCTNRHIHACLDKLKACIERTEAAPGKYLDYTMYMYVFPNRLTRKNVFVVKG